MHRFEFDAAGTLRHYIADELRATVAAENVAAYRECQPDTPAAPQAARGTQDAPQADQGTQDAPQAAQGTQDAPQADQGTQDAPQADQSATTEDTPK